MTDHVRETEQGQNHQTRELVPARACNGDVN